MHFLWKLAFVACSEKYDMRDEVCNFVHVWESMISKKGVREVHKRRLNLRRQKSHPRFWYG